MMGRNLKGRQMGLILQLSSIHLGMSQEGPTTYDSTMKALFDRFEEIFKGVPGAAS